MALVLSLAAFAANPASSFAQSTFTPTVTASWNVGGNWSPAGVPNSIGAATIFNSPTAAQTINLDAAITVGSITFTNDSTFISTIANGTGGSLNFSVTSGQAAFTANGISATTNNTTVSAAVTLTSDLNLTVNNTAATGAAAATFTGAVTGAGGIIKNGDGSFTFSTSAKAYTGATVINGGYLRYTATGVSNATSAITVNSGGQLRLDTGTGAFNFGSATITLNGSGSTGVLASQGAMRNQNSGASTLSNNVTLASNSTIHINTTGTSLQLNGNLGGSSTLTKTGAGTLIVNGSANTFTGGITVTNGVVTFTATSAIGGGILNLNQSTTNSTTFNINSANTVSNLQTTWTDTTGTLSQVVNTGNVATNILTINQSANTTFGNGAVATLTGVITGTGGIAMGNSSTGTLTLSGTNTYTGSTAINGGKLMINSTGTINTTSGLTLNGSSAEFNYNSTTAYGGGPITLTQGKISGTGAINKAVTAGTNGVLSPGNSPGSQTYSAGLTFNNGGTYLWEINNWTATPTAGVDHDQISVSGANLNISGLTAGSFPANTFKIAITGLNGSNAIGTVPGFDNTVSRSWIILSATGITGSFDPSMFTLDTSDFATNNSLGSGAFSITSSANNLVLSFTPVPEPATILGLSAFGALAVGGLRRRFGKKA